MQKSSAIAMRHPISHAVQVGATDQNISTGICFATSREILKEGLDRLERGMERLLRESRA